MYFDGSLNFRFSITYFFSFVIDTSACRVHIVTWRKKKIINCSHYGRLILASFFFFVFKWQKMFCIRPNIPFKSLFIRFVCFSSSTSLESHKIYVFRSSFIALVSFDIFYPPFAKCNPTLLRCSPDQHFYFRIWEILRWATTAHIVHAKVYIMLQLFFFFTLNIFEFGYSVMKMRYSIKKYSVGIKKHSE